MPFCRNCGQQLNDGQKFCAKCGAQQEQPVNVQQPAYQSAPQYQYRGGASGPPYPRELSSGLYTAAFVLMIITAVGLVISAIVVFAMAGMAASYSYYYDESAAAGGLGVLYLIPLAWIIPMLLKVLKIKKGEKPNTTGFGVCVLIFANFISGILLLVAPKDQ